MVKQRILNIFLALVACFELASLTNYPIHQVAASSKAFSINFCSSLGKLPIEENDIEIAGVGSDFCLFNEFSDISYASENIIAFKSTPIKIKNNSMQAIQIYINKFINNSEKYNIVNREDLCHGGNNLALGIANSNSQIAWFNEYSNGVKWICNLAEFPQQYPVFTNLSGKTVASFYIVGVYQGQFSSKDDVDISMLFEINDQIEEPDISLNNVECLQIKDAESSVQKTGTHSGTLTDSEEKALQESALKSKPDTKAALNELDEPHGDITDEIKETTSEKLTSASNMPTAEQKIEFPAPTELQDVLQQPSADSSLENELQLPATEENNVVEKEKEVDEELAPLVPAEVVEPLD